MNIHRAKRIRGWMDEVELTWLAGQAETHTKIVEIGSFLGRSCRVLADNTLGTVTAVDTWNFEHPAYGDVTTLFAEFKSNMTGCDNLRIVKKLSVAAAQELADERFDMVFLDGDHTYEGVKADIEAWGPLVTVGGLLCGHDYTDHESVRRAVMELLPGARVEANSIWAIRL